jgi:hypothetical protein
MEWVAMHQKKEMSSFGIFVMELFTGKRSTDKMFEDNFNLHNFVKMAMSEKLMQIIDPNILTREVNEISMPIENDSYKYDDRDDIEEVEEESHIENVSQMNISMRKCLLLVFKIKSCCHTVMVERCGFLPTNNKLAPQHFKKKKMYKFKMKLKHPLPTSGKQTLPPTALFDDFSSEKKKKKKKKKEEEDRYGHWGWPRSTPTTRRREIRPPPVAIFVSGEPKKKKKKKKKKDMSIRGGHDPPPVAWGWPQSTLTTRGREIRPPPEGFFLSSEPKKKKDSISLKNRF